jgi:carboxyl-terminal processing protease
LFGIEGSRVTLELQGALDAKPRRVEVTRSQLCTPSVTDARIVDPNLGIGYIHLAYFQRLTPDELDAAITKLNAEGMRALILDLRGNPGGLFTIAIQIADRFIAEGVLVSTRGRTEGSNAVHRARADDLAFAMPLVVLIDGETASAAEVVAGAIKDHHRGRLVGQQTYGKGSVQHLIPLRKEWGGSGILLTTAKFYSPLDLAYSDQGVIPDVIIDQVADLDGMPSSMMGILDLQRRQFEEALRIARQLLEKP